MNYIKETVQSQKEFFKSGATKNIEFRLWQLELLEMSIKKHSNQITKALYLDFKKPYLETQTNEIYMVLNEINFFRKNLEKLSKPKRVKSGIINFPSTSKIYPEPYGVSLIISPWNYPFQLSLLPLVGAIAAGNCAILKPSEYTPNTTKVLKDIIEEVYPPKYVALIDGDYHISNELLNNDIDYIFFTGSPSVGKMVMQKAAKKLIPITLELGGKSPCIIDRDANLKSAAKKVAWGKFINAGQTCVAPDYLIVSSHIKDEFMYYLTRYLFKFYSKDPKSSGSYCRIINKKHFDRLSKLIDKNKLYFGGETDKDDLFISPTILHNVDLDDPIMQEEIFGPILPVLTFNNINQIPNIVSHNPKPLALYYFGKNENRKRYIINNISFGGGCINDTIMHLSTNSLPFGGVGPSGIGSYHGKYSFNTFTHFKPILEKSIPLDIPFKYPPYNNRSNIIKKFISL